MTHSLLSSQPRPPCTAKRWPSSAATAALLLCIASLPLIGCGQKGPLLLPESATPASSSEGGAGESEREDEDASRNGSSDTATDSADGAIDGG